MKKSFFKVLSVITALCVFLGAMPVFVSAKSDEVLSFGGEDIIYYSPKTELPLQFGGTANQFYSSGVSVDTSKYFYNQLTASQKSLYDQIKSAGPVQNIAIDMTGITITATGSTQEEAQNALISKTTEEIKAALSALIEDYPLFFWLSGFGWNNGRLTMTVSGGVYTAKLTSVTVVININSTHFTDFNDVQTKYDAVIEKLSTIKINGINRHERLKSIHDYLADNIVYDTTISESNIYDLYGALVNGVCVCEGYAEATKVLCDREGIPCITVVGTGNGGAHKWNYVQMEDDQWYLYDVTWDDQEEYTFYSYFLTGSNTTAIYFNPEVADSTIHIPTGQIFSGTNAALSYPTLNAEQYCYLFLAPNVKDFSFDTQRKVCIVGKDTEYMGAFEWLFTDENLGVTFDSYNYTSDKLVVKNAETYEQKLNFTVATRGDIDGSHSTDIYDYDNVVKASSTQYMVPNDNGLYGGDMTQDGAIDGFDAIALDLYLNNQLIFD